MSALALLKDAAECSMHVSLSGGSLALEATPKPSADLLAKTPKAQTRHCCSAAARGTRRPPGRLFRSRMVRSHRRRQTARLST